MVGYDSHGLAVPGPRDDNFLRARHLGPLLHLRQEAVAAILLLQHQQFPALLQAVGVQTQHFVSGGVGLGQGGGGESGPPIHYFLHHNRVITVDGFFAVRRGFDDRKWGFVPQFADEVGELLVALQEGLPGGVGAAPRVDEGEEGGDLTLDGDADFFFGGAVGRGNGERVLAWGGGRGKVFGLGVPHAGPHEVNVDTNGRKNEIVGTGAGVLVHTHLTLMAHLKRKKRLNPINDIISW